MTISAKCWETLLSNQNHQLKLHRHMASTYDELLELILSNVFIIAATIAVLRSRARHAAPMRVAKDMSSVLLNSLNRRALWRDVRRQPESATETSAQTHTRTQLSASCHTHLNPAVTKALVNAVDSFHRGPLVLAPTFACAIGRSGRP